jgi:hypothetical protein
MNIVRYLLNGVFFVLFSSLSVFADFVTIAYDGFNYSSGTSLTTLNGGTGWDTAWYRSYTFGGDFNIGNSGYTYTGLATEGNRIVWGSGGSTGISEADRRLPRQDTGVIYLQFMSSFESSAGGGTPTLRLYDYNSSSGISTFNGGFGANNGGSYSGVMSILGSDMQPMGDGSSSTAASLNTINLVVVRIDYDNPFTEMWVNPDLATFDYNDPPASQAYYNNFAPVFNQVAVYCRTPANLDELRILQQVPEPTTLSLIFVGLLLVWRRLKD